MQPVGELDATLIGDLAVEICEWKGTGCGTRVGCLTARSHGAERLRIEHDDIDHYHANWRVAATLSEQVS
ncbi:MAG: hypothetical protein HY704_16680 [Gemmatimonadetes bacterium]|nr:hypothetical protein [Gemmatimonadota bacterium]